MSSSNAFQNALTKLNPAQKEAVTSIEGPVMVVAGPGTGKTQVLSLRIANILTQTDTPAGSVLCLTFTNAGVSAMRERLFNFIGATAGTVRISTFHAFAMDLVEKHYEVLGFGTAPQLLDDRGAVLLVDAILHDHEWEHIRPRGNAGMYFNDLKSLISLLKRERMSPEDFLREIEHAIAALEADPDNISSRGPSKGELKKEVQKKIEGLERTREVVRFYELYEAEKHERALMDYDDVLNYAVRLVEESDEVAADLRENFLYVLVDEHQDSSGIQNDFLKAVWQEVESPNIFVVGDDRQLIYGFGGASLSYFEEFRTAFGKAKCITLVENYRSTAAILSAADALLASSLATEKLRSNHPESHPLVLAEYEYPRDEIIAAARAAQEKIQQGVPAHECAILVPRNRHARAAVAIIRDMGLPVATDESLSFFDTRETTSLRTILAIVANPYDTVSLGRSLFDPVSGISAFQAHTFLRETDSRALSVSKLMEARGDGTLFAEVSPIATWGKTLARFVDAQTTNDIYTLIQIIGEEVFLKHATTHETLVRRVEVIRTFLHLAIVAQEKNTKLTLADFLSYLDRLEGYGTHIPLASIGGGDGIRVMTLHASKGLEFEFVWIAHLNEKILMGGKRLGFTLPESVEAHIESKDAEVVKRELYVALTRAKRFCSLSYARKNYTGGEQELAHVVLGIPETQFVRTSMEETKQELESADVRMYVTKREAPRESELDKVITAVAQNYARTKVSVTLLNNFFECPWKWYFRNILQLPEAKTESLIFGTVVHAGIEHVLTAPKKPTKKELEATFEKAIERESVIDPKLQTRIIKEAHEVLEAFIKHHLPTLEKKHDAERPLSFHDKLVPNLTMYGKIDLTERLPDGTVRVVDFKTGGAKTRSVIEKETDEGRLSNYLRQLVMYSYLIQGAEKNTEVIESRLLYVEADPTSKDAVYTTRITDEQIDALKRDIKDYDTFVASGDWVNRPCDVKPFGAQTECEYCALAHEVYGITKPLA